MNALIIRFAGDSAERAGRFDRRRERNANCVTYSRNKCTEIRLRQLMCREGGVHASSAHVALQVDR